jgi:hypothetical protein
MGECLQEAKVKKNKVTINPDYFGPGNGLYVIHFEGGCSTFGFDRVMELGNLLAAELDRWDLTPLPAERGTMKAYRKYRQLSDLVHQKHRQTGYRSRAELTPQLIGLEGKRVEVVDRYGEKRRFWVGKSTGWIPCHLEISTRRSDGGPAVMGAPFKSVRVV